MLIARASNAVRNKNLIILVMCLVFCGMFIWDGFKAYPARNNYKIANVLNEHASAVSSEHLKVFEDYAKVGGWDKASPELRQQVDDALRGEAEHIGTEGWKSPFDVKLQQGIAIGLVGCVAAAIWWFIRCQKRRVIAEGNTVSPAPNVVIPWDKITVVDNSRWKKVGIVDITYTDDAGMSQKAEFDDYKVQREPLLAILDMLAEKAVNAEFLPKEEATEPAHDEQKDTTESPGSTGGS